MDIFDRAQDLDAAFRNMSIAAARRQSSQPRYPVIAAGTCAWCGEEIPEARRQAVPGCELCTRCQEEKEHMKERT